MDDFFLPQDKNNVSLSRYLYFCVFDEYADSKICDFIIDITKY